MLKEIRHDPALADGKARGKDVRALEKVFENLGLDPKQPEHWDRLRETIVTSEFFGQPPTVGRPKGTKKWDFDRLFVLGAHLYQIELDYPNARDTQLAVQIQRRWPDDYKRENTDTFRKRLPMARRNFKSLMTIIEDQSSSLVRSAEEFGYCFFGLSPEQLGERFRKEWPRLRVGLIGNIIKAGAEVRRDEERQRRKERRA
jgi:hypothetical protein